MKNRYIYSSLLAASMLLMAPPSFAADAETAAPQSATSVAKPGTKTAKPKVAKNVKLVDINSASVKELATLPGITAQDAAKIVAGRPYGSKAWLVTNNILPQSKYPAISGLVIARQPFKDAAKNIEWLNKAKKTAP
ncbi:helix-hairpin-helix motif protein [mine drainage metagenome]|uniref:Helix-hairpin-helix motif protein n=1 Tax=mine drainage metagenome TaxID=410659 RepID=A0A1J5QRW3_9ZZZZ